MAQRLATEYVKTCLVLNETELFQLLELFRNHQLVFKVKVLDTGDQEVLVENAEGTESLSLTFERRLGKYVMNCSCRFTDMGLANAMRKAVARFKGDAVVNRIYKYYTLEYRYRSGLVTRITERTRQGERLVFERKDSIGDIVRMMNCNSAEAQIQVTKMEIDGLLDRRNRCRDERERACIDQGLKQLAHQLFVLEA